MATTDLKLDEPGSLPRPGPVGRVVRLLFGLLCLWYVYGLMQFSGNLMDGDGHIRSIVWNGILPGLFLISYIVNIGFSRAWKKLPAIASAGVFLLVAGIAYLSQGTVETISLAQTIWAWEIYAFSHLGISFLVAGLIATPGCEMRALHYLYSKITGVPTKEHYCPIGPLHSIDQWEANRIQR
jgi:hypothetical protein